MSEAEPTALLPCPFCGASSAGISRMTVTPDGYKVRCNTCFARTQDERSEAKAIQSWNTRAHSPAQAEQERLEGEVIEAAKAWRRDWLMNARPLRLAIDTLESFELETRALEAEQQ